MKITTTTTNDGRTTSTTDVVEFDNEVIAAAVERAYPHTAKLSGSTITITSYLCKYEERHSRLIEIANEMEGQYTGLVAAIGAAALTTWSKVTALSDQANNHQACAAQQAAQIANLSAAVNAIQSAHARRPRLVRWLCSLWS